MLNLINQFMTVLDIYNHGIIIWCRPKHEREERGGGGGGGGRGGGEVELSIVV